MLHFRFKVCKNNHFWSTTSYFVVRQHMKIHFAIFVLFYLFGVFNLDLYHYISEHLSCASSINTRANFDGRANPYEKSHTYRQSFAKLVKKSHCEFNVSNFWRLPVRQRLWNYSVNETDNHFTVLVNNDKYKSQHKSRASSTFFLQLLHLLHIVNTQSTQNLSAVPSCGSIELETAHEQTIQSILSLIRACLERRYPGHLAIEV